MKPSTPVPSMFAVALVAVLCVATPSFGQNGFVFGDLFQQLVKGGYRGNQNTNTQAFNPKVIPNPNIGNLGGQRQNQNIGPPNSDFGSNPQNQNFGGNPPPFEVFRPPPNQNSVHGVSQDFRAPTEQNVVSNPAIDNHFWSVEQPSTLSPNFVGQHDTTAVQNQNFGGNQIPNVVGNLNSNFGGSQNPNLGGNQNQVPRGQSTFQEPEDSCRAVDGSIGSCVKIKSCAPFVALLQNLRNNPASQNVRSLLRSSHCGFDGNDPKVCCPVSRPIPTQAPPTILEPVTKDPTATQAPLEPTTTHQATADWRYVTSLPEPPLCGVSNASIGRVVGGVDAKLGEFPFMALLGYHPRRRSTSGDDGPRWLCGGSLITDKHVLTAAHCIHGREDDLYLVRVGELDLESDTEGATPIDVPIRQKIKHQQYSAKSFTNDIGVLVLAHSVQFTDLIRPICLPQPERLRSQTFDRYNPFIAGWGDIEFRGPSSPRLQVLQLPVVSLSSCQNAYKAYKAQVIDQRVLCAGYEKGGKDACQGDSGGPLIHPDYNFETTKTYFYQIGVVSFGRKCAEAGYPGVYTRVTQFMPWIEQTILPSESNT